MPQPMQWSALRQWAREKVVGEVRRSPLQKEIRGHGMEVREYVCAMWGAWETMGISQETWTSSFFQPRRGKHVAFWPKRAWMM